MGCIYLLYDNDGLCYVGKTNNIENRLYLHKSKSNQTRSRYLNKDFKCDVIVECDNEDELAKLEQTYFDYYKDLCGEKCVNFIRPLQTSKEYYETHREKTLEYRKQYYEENKQKFVELRKNYYEIHKEQISQQKKQKITCECGSVVQYSEKARHAKSIKHKNYIKHLPT